MDKLTILNDILTDVDDFNSWHPKEKVYFATMKDGLFLYKQKNNVPVFKVNSLGTFKKMFNAYWSGFQDGATSERRR